MWVHSSCNSPAAACKKSLSATKVLLTTRFLKQVEMILHARIQRCNVQTTAKNLLLNVQQHLTLNATSSKCVFQVLESTTCIFEKKLYKAFLCGSGGSCVKSDKLPQVMFRRV